MKLANRVARSNLLILGLGAFMMFSGGCGGEEEQAAPTIRPVRYQQVYATGGARVRSFTGTSQAGVESRLSFKVPGNIQRVSVDVGDLVRAGDLIAELDPQDYRLQVEEAEASLHRYEAQERNASASYDRVRGLYENGHASLGELDAARAAFETAQAAVRAAVKGLEQARNQLGYARLASPVEGSVAEVKVEENENVTAGQVVTVLTSGSQPEVRVSVPEILIARVKEGETVSVTFDAVPGRRFSAVITEVGVAAGAAATTYPVTVRLSEADADIRPGMAAEVAFAFEFDDRRERLCVPPVAVGEDRAGRFIFVIEELTGDVGTARRRTVEVGELSAEGIEILAGLSDGDLLVIAGVNKLVDGQQVKLLPKAEMQ